MSKNPNDSLSNFDMSFDEVKAYFNPKPVHKDPYADIPRNRNYNFNLGAIERIKSSDYPDSRYYDLIYQLYDLICASAFKNIQSTLKGNIPVCGQYQVYNSDMSKLYSVNIPNFYTKYEEYDGQYLDPRYVPYLYSNSTLNDIISGFNALDENSQRFVQININKGTFARNEYVFGSKSEYESGKIVFFANGKKYATNNIADFISTIPIEYVKVLFKECINYANSSENINGCPVTNIEANIKIGYDYRTKKDGAVESVWTRKLHRDQYWRYLDSMYDI